MVWLDSPSAGNIGVSAGWAKGKATGGSLEQKEMLDVRETRLGPGYLRGSLNSDGGNWNRVSVDGYLAASGAYRASERALTCILPALTCEGLKLRS